MRRTQGHSGVKGLGEDGLHYMYKYSVESQLSAHGEYITGRKHLFDNVP